MGKPVLETPMTCQEDRSPAGSLSQKKLASLVIATASIVLVNKKLLPVARLCCMVFTGADPLPLQSELQLHYSGPWCEMLSVIIWLGKNASSSKSLGCFVHTAGTGDPALSLISSHSLSPSLTLAWYTSDMFFYSFRLTDKQVWLNLDKLCASLVYLITEVQAACGLSTSFRELA